MIQYFEETPQGEVVRLTLNEDDRQEFLNGLPNDFCLSYVSKKKLEGLAGANEVSKREYFESFLIPETPAYANIRSGDFGEMLCFMLLKSKADQNGVWLVGPRKWRWKSDKNKACHGSDVVLFHRHQRQPSAEDGVAVVESKMKAVAGASSPIQKAVDGAIDDKTKRLAKTLNWLNDRLAAEEKPRLREALNRYRFTDENPTYFKKFHAISIIDDSLLDDEVAKELDLDGHDIEVLVVSMNNLKEAYEVTYEAMLDSLG